MEIDFGPLSDAIDPNGHDLRSVDALLAAVLGTDPEENDYWDAIRALQWRGTREVFDRAVALGRSDCPHERSIGATVLGQNLVPHCHWADECLSRLLEMLSIDKDPHVLHEILCALSHLKRPEAIDPALSLLDHADADVRFGVVHALLTHEHNRAIAGLILLSRDPAAHVRDWATFGLGSMVDEVDTPELRQALVDRLDDQDIPTRTEAIIGLASRQDSRVLPVLQRILASNDVCCGDVEAAGLLGDPSLLRLLIDLQGWSNVSPSELAEAIAACSPRSALPS